MFCFPLTAVQHERAPRSCISNQPSNGLAASTLDLYAAQRRLPLHPSNIVLPMPIHLPLPTAFSPIDVHRYLPPGTPYHPPNFLDSLHYGSGVFTVPTAPARPFLKLNDGVLTQPTPTRPLFKMPDRPTAKEDEVTSSEETKLMELPSYLPGTITSAYNLETEAVSESAAKLLFLAVKWAKSVPSFNHISLRDQNLLIAESWAELFVITSAQYGLPIESV